MILRRSSLRGGLLELEAAALLFLAASTEGA